MPETPIVNLYRIDLNNIGDIASPPFRYFDFKRPVVERELGGEPKQSDILIVGGGGQFQFNHVGDHVSRSIASIGWGIGSNDHGVHYATPPPPWADRMTMMGCRDRGSSRWVPCASCMSPVFDEMAGLHPVHEFVLYDHHMFGVGRPPVFSGIPYATNRDFDFSKTIEFIASGSVVITTSYHGAYWATLLNRPVVVVNPWSSKFYTFQHPPTIADAEDWREAAHMADNYPNALHECRAANQSFYEDVMKLLANIP